MSNFKPLYQPSEAEPRQQEIEADRSMIEHAMLSDADGAWIAESDRQKLIELGAAQFDCELERIRRKHAERERDLYSQIRELSAALHDQVNPSLLDAIADAGITLRGLVALRFDQGLGQVKIEYDDDAITLPLGPKNMARLTHDLAQTANTNATRRSAETPPNGSTPEMNRDLTFAVREGDAPTPSIQDTVDLANVSLTHTREGLLIVLPNANNNPIRLLISHESPSVATSDCQP